MKRYSYIILISLFVFVVSCGSGDRMSDDSLVTIKTEFGEIKVKLYDDTPEHKTNFLKLVNEGFYDNLLFHRVISNFMIQGGDPDSKDAQADVRLGSGTPGYTIPAEINPKYIHKKGALAAARKGGPSNPEKRSNGSQFYIIHGEVFSPGKLDTLAMMKNDRLKNELMKEKFTEANAELNEFQKNQDQEGFNLCIAKIREEVDSIFNASPQFKFTDAQKEVYTTVGGYPSLDGDYTVFGEVVEGLEVLDEIAAVETDKYDRPIQDVKMRLEILK